MALSRRRKGRQSGAQLHPDPHPFPGPDRVNPMQQSEEEPMNHFKSELTLNAQRSTLNVQVKAGPLRVVRSVGAGLWRLAFVGGLLLSVTISFAAEKKNAPDPSTVFQPMPWEQQAVSNKVDQAQTWD